MGLSKLSHWCVSFSRKAITRDQTCLLLKGPVVLMKNACAQAPGALGSGTGLSAGPPRGLETPHLESC